MSYTNILDAITAVGIFSGVAILLALRLSVSRYFWTSRPARDVVGPMNSQDFEALNDQLLLAFGTSESRALEMPPVIEDMTDYVTEES